MFTLVVPTSGAYQISIMTPNGRRVAQINQNLLENRKQTIHLQNTLSNGTYVIKILSKEFSVVKTVSIIR